MSIETAKTFYEKASSTVGTVYAKASNMARATTREALNLVGKTCDVAGKVLIVAGPVLGGALFTDAFAWNRKYGDNPQKAFESCNELWKDDANAVDVCSVGKLPFYMILPVLGDAKKIHSSDVAVFPTINKVAMMVSVGLAVAGPLVGLACRKVRHLTDYINKNLLS